MFYISVIVRVRTVAVVLVCFVKINLVLDTSDCQISVDFFVDK